MFTLKVFGGLARKLSGTILVALLVLAVSPIVNAQGFATWLGDRIGVGNVGRALDDANRTAKKAVPLYGQAEEIVVDAAKHVVTEPLVESAAPVLKNYILASRQDAFGAGATPLPPEIVWEFSGFYSPDVLSAYWLIGYGGDLSLQANTFRFGDRAAIALDTVVVMRSWQDANSLWLWAHELAHIEQYRRWGIDDFTKRYIRNFDGIESDANRRANEFMVWRLNRMNKPVNNSQQSQQSQGFMCVTNVGQCNWVGPVGWSCSCAFNGNLFNGVIR